MTSSFSTEEDVKEYLVSFSTNVKKASEYWASDLLVVLGSTVHLTSCEEAVEFFSEQRGIINENVAPESIVLNDDTCVVHAIVTFTPLRDLPQVSGRISLSSE